MFAAGELIMLGMIDVRARRPTLQANERARGGAILFLWAY